ncbi:hypothetical protein [Dactylosporangium matsuzakiense]|uniref:Secreted protein n=1 Tax=Dactylosporangium matsuzakiense TaxID=53360 RepID=A0A9W6NMM0_9ACTN|nr:hypothetical protein [Dactylosporangium matsuzakiense]UWZ41555.1 hypothetical protein Dmats_28310 [Dactylosporangium matsuzakiense]GLL02381.1 hypothetical protein GCM10017581_041230 [Dactylosporangium matsuzakiense]
MFLTLAVLLLSAETPAAAALAALLVEELDATLHDPDLPWRRRPRSPLFARRGTDSATTRRLWSALVTRCLVDDPAVTDPRLTALGNALAAATPIAELRALFTGATQRGCPSTPAAHGASRRSGPGPLSSTASGPAALRAPRPGSR